jgi:hypothetical protein
MIHYLLAHGQVLSVIQGKNTEQYFCIARVGAHSSVVHRGCSDCHTEETAAKG